MQRLIPVLALAMLLLSANAPALSAGPASPAAVSAGPVHYAAECPGGSERAVLRLSVGGSAGCLIVPAFPPLVEVAVLADIVPVAKIRFSLPDPPFGTLVGETYNYPYTGDRVAGMEMDLGGCASAGTVVLATLTILNPTGMLGECQDWRVDDGCETVDCNGFTQPAWSMHQSFSDPVASCPTCDNYWQECVAMPPYALDPPCDAGDVPVDAQLSWSGVSPLGKWRVRIGTDPDLAAGQNFWLDEATFTPGFLLPATTYYWQVAADLTGEACNGGVSAIHSFTTQGPTPAARESWGRVKALYR